MKPTGRGSSERQDAVADLPHSAACDVANLEFLRLGHRTPPPRTALGAGGRQRPKPGRKKKAAGRRFHYGGRSRPLPGSRSRRKGAAVRDKSVLLCARGRELEKRFLDGHRGTTNHPGFGWDKPRVFIPHTDGRNRKTGVLPPEASPRPRLRSRHQRSPRALTGRGSYPGGGGTWASASPRRIRCFEGRWPGPGGQRWNTAAPPKNPRQIHANFCRVFEKSAERGPPPATLAARSALKSALYDSLHPKPFRRRLPPARDAKSAG